MEVPGGHDNKVKVCLYEAFGAGLLLFVVNQSSAMGDDQPFAIGLILMANIMMFGAVSGAHFNPAVTVGTLISTSKKSFRENAPYALLIITSQIIGMIIAVCICYLCLNIGYAAADTAKATPILYSNNIAVLCPTNPLANTRRCDPSGGAMKLLITETIVTFIFVSTIGQIQELTGSKVTLVNAFTVGLTLCAMAICAAKNSGGCINPAVGLVQTIYQNMVLAKVTQTGGDGTVYVNKGPGMDCLAYYILGPLLGGTLAGLYQKFNQGRHAQRKDIIEAIKKMTEQHKVGSAAPDGMTDVNIADGNNFDTRIGS